MAAPPARLKVAILASGSRGDVQPYCALACALQQRGHDVVVATEERMQPLVQSFGLRYHKVRGDPTEILHTEEGVRLVAEAKFMKLMQIQGESAKKWWKQAAADYTAACEGVDVICTSPLCMTQGFCLAEKNSAKFMPMLLGPTLRTTEFPLFFLAGDRNLHCLNGCTYDMIFHALWGQEKVNINEFRAHLNLPPMTVGIAAQIDHHKPPIILACSPCFFPQGRVPADYPSNVFVVGFPFVPGAEERAIDPALVRFVSERVDSRPLVYFGLGSMPAPDPQRLYDLVAEACEVASCRAVLVAGWSSLLPAAHTDSGERSVLVVKECPHDWLFPRVRAIVHHCGIGTCAAAMRSGVPQVPCPVLLDQPFNAARLHKLGCGTEPLSFHKLTAADLAARLAEALQSDRMQARAKEIADLVSQDGDSIAKACAIVESGRVPNYGSPPPGGSCAIL